MPLVCPNAATLKTYADDPRILDRKRSRVKPTFVGISPHIASRLRDQVRLPHAIPCHYQLMEIRKKKQTGNTPCHVQICNARHVPVKRKGEDMRRQGQVHDADTQTKHTQGVLDERSMNKEQKKATTDIQNASLAPAPAPDQVM
ncbi:hypothetical protein VTH06DRAFT_6061 [Thermothelomyces fergusii]